MATGAQPASWTYEAEVPVLELASEEKAFPARKESFDELGMAKDWFYLVAERRRYPAQGRHTPHLENAKRYFGIAEAKSKRGWCKTRP